MPENDLPTAANPWTVHTNPMSTDSDDDEILENRYLRCDDDNISQQDGMVCGEARASCGRFAAFQEKYLGPLSPERHPAVWMSINAFCLAWSLSLGVYLTLLYVWYGNEVVASKATTTEYLLYSLLTTLVWVVEISLKAAFPGLDTVLVVSTPNQSDDEEQVVEAPETQMQHQFLRTFTTEESVVTIETIVQQRSKTTWTVLITELLLAVFFGIETILDCWNHWNYHKAEQASETTNDDTYFAYEEELEHYGMLQQESDIWINVLAYAYMTYHTYHEYYKHRSTRLEIRRSLSTTILNHPQLQHQHQQQSLQSLQSLQSHYPQQHFPDPAASPNATLRTSFTRSAMEESGSSNVPVVPPTPISIMASASKNAPLATDQINNKDDELLVLQQETEQQTHERLLGIPLSEQEQESESSPIRTTTTATTTTTTEIREPNNTGLPSKAAHPSAPPASALPTSEVAEGHSVPEMPLQF